MLTDRRGHKRRFIYQPQGEFATPADIPTAIERAHRDLDGDLKPGQCALRRGKIVVADFRFEWNISDPRDFGQRLAAYVSAQIADAYRAGMVAATKLTRAR